jgi:protein SCO1/2
MATPTTEQSKPTAPRRPVRNNALLLRRISRISVGTLVVVIAAVLISRTLFTDNRNAAAPLKGTSLGGTAAPNFTLTDQHGNHVSLSAFHGHPVVLTFFYTHCTDECPLTASKFQSVLQGSGSQFNTVRWVAVSTDPVGDTSQTATSFVEKHGLTGTLHYLLGTHAELTPVWSAYSVAVEGGATTPGESDGGKVQHTGGVWLIDAQGRERVYLDAAFDPQALADDLKILTSSN